MAASAHPRATPSRSQASPNAVQNARRATSNRAAGSPVRSSSSSSADTPALSPTGFASNARAREDDAGPIEVIAAAQHAGRAVEHPRALGRVLPEQPIETRMVVEPRMRLDRERDRREKRAAPVLRAPEPLRNRMDDAGGEARARRRRRMERADPVRSRGASRQRRTRRTNPGCGPRERQPPPGAGSPARGRLPARRRRRDPAAAAACSEGACSTRPPDRPRACRTQPDRRAGPARLPARP